MDFNNNKAIVVSDRGDVKSVLLYEDVRKTRDLIIGFISRHIKDKHLCIGLEMTHNIYIPSIVLSLQELQHAFIFLSEESSNSSIIEELEIVWVLSLTKTLNCVDTLPLTHHNVFLIKHGFSSSKSYDNIYYIIRTSGTTGQNKFVKVEKHCIESNVRSLSRLFKITENDTIFFGTPLTFDPSMVELLLALKSGACLLTTSATNKINPIHLHQTLFCSKNGITILQIVPSLFMRWSPLQIQSILINPSLKVLVFGGEAFPRPVLDYKKSNALRIFNVYGITEVSCWATAHETSPDDEAIPIGTPLDETIIEVRDESGCKITNGDGEIFIGSQSRVCLVDDEASHHKPVFRATGDIASVSNRGIFYKGRKNDVFKRLGHKIHLSKIEDIILKETSLQNVGVWLKSQSKLLIFIINENCGDMKDKIIDKLRIKLLHTLPKHYYPDHIDMIRKCPITGHGKIDKNALISVYLKRDKVDNDQIGVDVFRSLLCQYFGISQCQLDGLMQSTFFDIGGNSILAIQLLEELGTEYPPDLVTALFEKDLGACLVCLESIQIPRKRPKIQESPPTKAIKKKKSEVKLKIRWTYNLEACVDSSPLVFTKGDRRLVAVGSFSHIFAVINADSGEEVCRFVLPDVVENTACVSHCRDYLYVGCFDGKMYCFRYLQNEIKWTYSTGDRIKCRPVRCRGSAAIVFGSYDKYVHCVDGSDGTSIWKTFVSEGVASTPLLDQERIFVATIYGTCLCLSEANGAILWTYKSKSPIFGAPCAFNNTILWPNVHGNVLCLSNEGVKIWQYGCGGHLYSSLLLHRDRVVFGCHDHNLHILRVVDGPELLNIVNLNDQISSTPCLWRDFIIVATNSGCVFVVDFEGFVVAEVCLPGQVFSSASVCENKIYVGCRDNNLYCIDIN